MESLLPFFQWCDATTVGQWIRGSTWIFPLIETIHILALTVLFGTVLVIDLRLMGSGLTGQPVSVIARHLRPWMRGGLAVILVSGVLLFLSEAMKCYGNDAFRFKMVALLLALGFSSQSFRTSHLRRARLECGPSGRRQPRSCQWRCGSASESVAGRSDSSERLQSAGR